MQLVYLFALFLGAAVAQIPLECANPVNRLETDDIPVLDVENSGFLAANVLTLVISSTLVNERADAEIVLSATQLDCNYPGPYWVRTQENADCTETWTASLPWSVARQCDLTREETSDEIIFTGEIAVLQVEDLDVVRGTAITRDLSTGFEYELTFPKEISLTSGDVAVFAPVDVQAAVIGQAFEVLEAEGTVLLFTSVQYPFMLTGAAVSTQLADGTTVAIALPVGQNCPAGAPCETTYTLVVAPGACTLSGGYQLSFELECNPAFTDTCPLQGEAGTVQFTLESQDLCALLRENVDLSGELRSYLADYATLRDAFLQEQTAYWVAEVSSSKVSIADSQITYVATVYDGGAEQALFAGGAATAAGALASFALDGNGGQPTASRFRFDTLASLYPVPADEFRTAVVMCTVAVTYENTAAKRRVTRYATVGIPVQARASSKRSCLGLGGRSLVRSVDSAVGLVERAIPDNKKQDLKTEARIGLSRSVQEEEEGPVVRPAGPKDEEEVGGSGGGTGFIPYVATAAVIAMMACCGLVVVAARRRRQQEQRQEEGAASPVEPQQQQHTAIALPAYLNPAAVGRTSSKTVEGKVYDQLAA